jgi:hypothetical protein
MDQVVGQALATFRRLDAKRKTGTTSGAKPSLWIDAAE